MELKIIQPILLENFLAEVPVGLHHTFETLQEAELSTANFSFYTSVASVFSSKIEGEQIELDSYIKHKRYGISFQTDYTKKIDDLYDAYLFAQKNRLTEKTVNQAHKLLSIHFVATTCQGKYRLQNMFVATEEGRNEYVAARPQIVESEKSKFFLDIGVLLDASMFLEEVFYYASLNHLVFVKIHPWNDGNGRSARLIEKWFLAEKLGSKAWFIQIKKLYYQQHQTYFMNLRALGLEYEELNYIKALPFLLMLPNSLSNG